MSIRGTIFNVIVQPDTDGDVLTAENYNSLPAIESGSEILSKAK